MEDKSITETYKDTIFKKSIMAQEQAQQIVELFSRGGFEEFHARFVDVQQLMSCYRCAILEVETKFKVLDEQLSLLYERNPIDSITSRLKSPESIYEKVVRKHLPPGIESIEKNLCDIAGVRVVCSFVDDIYMLAQSFLRQDDVKLIQMKDYIKNPKPNGYRSLHLIVEVPIFLTDEKKMMRVEVQLRTIAMDLWASLEHKIYYKKEMNKLTAENAASQLSECARMCAELDSKMQNIRNYIDSN
ncbi:MAG: GTP pyrophosphokinase family protein [Clostridia bacterium]|nr:GTP pyrophosphokinase family protein [Clostridia bacterium]